MLIQFSYVYRSCLDWKKSTFTRFIRKIVVTVGCTDEYACSSYFNFFTPKSWPVVFGEARNESFDSLNFTEPPICTAAKDTWRSDNNHIMQYLAERVYKAPSAVFLCRLCMTIIATGLPPLVCAVSWAANSLLTALRLLASQNPHGAVRATSS